MSAAISFSTGKTYGVARVCSAWGVARSSHYAGKARRIHSTPPPSKRGPRPLLSDEELLALIRDDLASSPFIGEGHRKVWERLRFVKGVKISLIPARDKKSRNLILNAPIVHFPLLKLQPALPNPIS